MKPVLKQAALGCAVGCAGLLATALLAGPATAAPVPPTDTAHPVFVQTDNPAGNTIVAYDRTITGSLAPAGSYPTGGLGGIVTPGNPDNLASQGSLAYEASTRLLFAVNAGSNTITTFAVHGDQLERRQVLPSGARSRQASPRTATSSMSLTPATAARSRATCAAAATSYVYRGGTATSGWTPAGSRTGRSVRLRSPRMATG